jgi:hypothetical protein
MQLKKIHEEMPIKASPEKIWEVVSQFGNVSDFHAGVVSSVREEGSQNSATIGCERICNIVDMGLHITLKERVVDCVEGESYQFEVYECRNFPVKEMFFRFTIKDATPKHSTLAIDIAYKAKPAVLTPLMSGKMKSLAREVLLGYKHYTETGEKRVPIKELKIRYRPNHFFAAKTDRFPAN